MFMVIGISFILATCLPILYQYIRHLLTLKNYPHGPFPIPVIGNLHLMTMKPHETLSDLSKIYGDVFSISFGMKRTVIINAIAPTREALITKSFDFAGRSTDSYVGNIASRGFVDIVLSDYNEEWLHRKNLTHSAMKVHDSSNIKTIITKESIELNSRLRNSAGRSINIQTDIELAVMNVLASTILGERYEVEDPDFIELATLNKMFLKSVENGTPVDFLPFLRYLPSKSLSLLKDYVRRRDDFVHRKITEHVDTYIEGQTRDFTDVLIGNLNEESKGKQKQLSYDNVEMIEAGLFIAGFESTTTTLCWMILYLLHWPKYQDQIYEEITNAVASDSYPDLKDIQHFHIVRAFINEAHRFSSVSPLGLPHKVLNDTSLSGMNIPKGAKVLFNYWNLHHDERHWDNPFEFRPERWLGKDGRYTTRKISSYMPFSSGKRVCIGESLARAELFLILTRLVKDFRLEKNLDEQLPTLKPAAGFTLSPMPFKVLIKSRE